MITIRDYTLVNCKENNNIAKDKYKGEKNENCNSSK